MPLTRVRTDGSRLEVRYGAVALALLAGCLLSEATFGVMRDQSRSFFDEFHRSGKTITVVTIDPEVACRAAILDCK